MDIQLNSQGRVQDKVSISNQYTDLSQRHQSLKEECLRLKARVLKLEQELVLFRSEFLMSVNQTSKL